MATLEQSAHGNEAVSESGDGVRRRDFINIAAVSFAGGADLPVYLRVTQADGHQAWTSPIYLID